MGIVKIKLHNGYGQGRKFGWLMKIVYVDKICLSPGIFSGYRFCTGWQESRNGGFSLTFWVICVKESAE